MRVNFRLNNELVTPKILTSIQSTSRSADCLVLSGLRSADCLILPSLRSRGPPRLLILWNFLARLQSLILFATCPGSLALLCLPFWFDLCSNLVNPLAFLLMEGDGWLDPEGVDAKILFIDNNINQNFSFSLFFSLPLSLSIYLSIYLSRWRERERYHRFYDINILL